MGEKLIVTTSLFEGMQFANSYQETTYISRDSPHLPSEASSSLSSDQAQSISQSFLLQFSSVSIWLHWLSHPFHLLSHLVRARNEEFVDSKAGEGNNA